MELARLRSLARAVSAVENRRAGWESIVRKGYADPDRSFVVGVTGPPGAGKSSLVDALACHWSQKGHSVAIVAVDPASPFSGGAVLGDRIRMHHAENDDSIFIRSISARGYAGGVNEAASDFCAVVSSYGFDRIIIETVGVGQNEVEIAHVADCTVIVSVPGLGDSVQAAKAGLLEVGDIYVVNKGDLPGASGVARDLEDMLALAFPAGSAAASLDNGPSSDFASRFGSAGTSAGQWRPPVLMVSATENTGIGELADQIDIFAGFLEDSGLKRSRRESRAARQLKTLLKERLLQRLLKRQGHLENGFVPWIRKIAAGHTDPHTAVDEIIKEVEKR